MWLTNSSLCARGTTLELVPWSPVGLAHAQLRDEGAALAAVGELLGRERRGATTEREAEAREAMLGSSGCHKARPRLEEMDALLCAGGWAWWVTELEGPWSELEADGRFQIEMEMTLIAVTRTL